MERSGLEQEKRALEVVLHQPEQSEATLETFKEFCSKVSFRLDALTFEGKQKIVHLLNILSRMDIELVPITSDQFPTPARRPLNSVLAPFPRPQLLGREMPSWREALKEYIRQRGTMRRAGV
jgi:dTDP-4-dehydrorhamnose reductase